MSEPKINGLDALSKVSGMKRETVNEIWEEVKANHALLNACPGPHTWQPHEYYGPKSGMVKRYICTKCQGKVDSTAKIWYDLGLRHGQANPK